MQSPESACHLCGKCTTYAENWAPIADELLRTYSPERKMEKGSLSDEKVKDK